MLQGLLDEYKPMLDSLNDTGTRLTDLLKGPAAKQIADIVADDNDKFDAINDLVQKRVDKFLRLFRQMIDSKAFYHLVQY